MRIFVVRTWVTGAALVAASKLLLGHSAVNKSSQCTNITHVDISVPAKQCFFALGVKKITVQIHLCHIELIEINKCSKMNSRRFLHPQSGQVCCVRPGCVLATRL